MFNNSREPAAYAEAVRLVIVALVSIGWVTIDQVTVNTIVSVVGGLLSLILTLIVRAHVTPVVTTPPSVIDELD